MLSSNLVTAAAKEPSPGGAVRFLWSGYLGEHKGILLFLEAIEQLSRERELSGRWHVMIAGEGHLRPTVEGALRSGKLGDNVRFVGRLPRAELLDLLRSTDVSVLTSIWPENEPVTLLEAIASGTAQIATRIGGNVGLVEHAKSGFLVSPNDAAELVDAMRRYIVEPGLAAQHGTRNRERRGEFDEARTIDKLEAGLAPDVPSEAPVYPREPVIVCGTELPPAEVAILLKRVHDYLPSDLIPRFVWHEWVEPAIWRDAKLVWLWDQHVSEGLFNEALRRGVPVLTPETTWAVGLARHYGGVIFYRTYLEALASLSALFSVPTLQTEFSWRARLAATAATALARSEAFSLHSEAKD